jgi:NitT/TauT family transport system substrate-binding protein
VTAFWPWLKAKFGFTDAQVRKYTHNNATFLADKRAIQEGYITSEPYTLKKEGGIEPKVFLLADAGYPGYAAMALATDKLIASNPAAVKAFVEASAKGWHDYLYGDPKPADALILKDNPEMTQDVLDQARDKMRAAGIVEDDDTKAHGIGTMSDKRWAESFKVGTDAGLYPATMDYKAGYTLNFVAPAP